jgi:CHAD domain-containing protein
MAKARDFSEGLPDDEAADLDPLFATWLEHRQAARAKMLAYLDGKRYQRFVREFGSFLDEEGAGALLPPPGKPVAYQVYQIVPTLIYGRYETVRGYEPVLADASLETLHALRIDCKRLRYALEFFREVLGPEARAVIKDVVTIQDHLGDLNDADVACRLMIEFLDGWSAREGRERVHIGGVTRYLVARQNELRALVDSFPQAWRNLNRPEVRRQLALAVSVL